MCVRCKNGKNDWGKKNPEQRKENYRRWAAANQERVQYHQYTEYKRKLRKRIGTKREKIAELEEAIIAQEIQG